MTDEEAVRLMLKSLEEVRETSRKWGRIVIEVSGGKIKFVTVEKSAENYNTKNTKI